MNARLLQPNQVVHYTDDLARKIAYGLNDDDHLKFYREMVRKHPLHSIKKAYMLTRKFQVITEYKIVAHEIFRLVIENYPPNEIERENRDPIKFN